MHLRTMSQSVPHEICLSSSEFMMSFSCCLISRTFFIAGKTGVQNIKNSCLSFFVQIKFDIFFHFKWNENLKTLFTLTLIDLFEYKFVSIKYVFGQCTFIVDVLINLLSFQIWKFRMFSPEKSRFWFMKNNNYFK